MILRKWVVVFAATVMAAGVVKAAEAGTWTGWYAEAFGGYIIGELNSNDPSHEASTGDYKDDGPTAGILGGYRYQNRKRWVFGAELVLPLYIAKGTAVDKQYFPDQVKYEADPQFALLGGFHAGRAFGKALPYVFGLVGFANVEGKTYNVDLEENYSPGFEQSSSANHLVWQVGVGLDYQLSRKVFVSGRVAAFIAERADHTMPWNEPGPNEFGYESVIVQFGLGYRF